MAAIIQQLTAWYKYLNEDLADPRTKNYFLIGSPWPGLTLIGFYIYFIYNLGPKLMEKRQAFKLYRIMQIYNILQILLNGHLFYRALTDGWLGQFNYFCEPIDYSNTPKAIMTLKCKNYLRGGIGNQNRLNDCCHKAVELSLQSCRYLITLKKARIVNRNVTRLVWYYFVIKVLDLMDTIFFVLRKKQNQVTFLHLYHHIGILMGAWGAVKYLPGGHVTFLGLLNTFIHVIMYTHYLLAAMKVNTSSWKKYITQLQLVQFCLITLHYLQLTWVEDCGFPLWPAFIMVPQNLFMIILFSDFYYKSYIKEKPPIKTVITKTEINGISAEIPNGKLKEQ